jgi:hypothetical protein
MMNIKLVGPPAALAALWATPVDAQSLTDAINAALANDCEQLGGDTARVTDRWLA